MKEVRRFSRRSLLGATAVGSAGLVLAACGQVQMTGEPMEQAEDAPKEEAEQPQMVEHAPVIALLISQRESTIARTAATLEQFDLDHPEVDVAWKLGYPPRELPPLLAAGSPPDVCWWGVAPHQVADLVRDHRPILKAHGIDISEFVEPVVKGNTWQGKLLGVPYGLNTTSLFYNKQHFDTAGLNYPTDDTTWEQVLDDAEKLTASLNQGQEKNTAWGISTSSYIPQYLPFVYAGMLDEDGELAADREIALQMVLMIKDAWVRRQAAPGPNNDDIDLSGFAINAFGNQQLSQVIFGTWGIVPSRDQAELKFDSFEPPYLQIGGGRTRGAFMGQEEHFVLESSTNPDAETLVVLVCEAELSAVDGQSRRRHSGSYSFAACLRPAGRRSTPSQPVVVRPQRGLCHAVLAAPGVQKFHGCPQYASEAALPGGGPVDVGRGGRKRVRGARAGYCGLEGGKRLSRVRSTFAHRSSSETGEGLSARTSRKLIEEGGTGALPPSSALDRLGRSRHAGGGIRKLLRRNRTRETARLKVMKHLLCAQIVRQAGRADTGRAVSQDHDAVAALAHGEDAVVAVRHAVVGGKAGVEEVADLDGSAQAVQLLAGRDHVVLFCGPDGAVNRALRVVLLPERQPLLAVVGFEVRPLSFTLREVGRRPVCHGLWRRCQLAITRVT